MGLLSKSIGFKALSLEDPAQPLLPMSALFDSLGLGRSDAGVLINEKQAMRLVVAYGCIKVISEDLGRLSLDIFQTLPDRSVRLAKEHARYSLLHDRPNPNMSSMTWRGAMLASALAYGNSYSWIKRDNAARPVALVPLDSGKTGTVRLNNGELVYGTTQTDTGAVRYLDPADVLHFMGLSLDGLTGMSPISTCKNAFGLGLAAEKFGAQFFGNGARATGVFTFPGQLETEAYENLKKSLRELLTGDNANRPLLLEQGTDWKQISIPPDDAQFLATRKFQKEEIACLYRVPMHLLQDLARATNNNIEHQGLDYTRFCLAPWAVKFEQEINFKLLGGAYWCEHNLNELQRGDFASQATGFASLRNIGVVSTNDIRGGLRMNKIPAEDGGDVYIIQGANVALSTLLGDPNEPEADTEADTDLENPAASYRRRQIVSAHKALFRSATERSIKLSGDADHARRMFYPVVTSVAQTLVASRFGSSELTKRELALIDAQVEDVAAVAHAWQKADVKAIASQVANQVYGALAGEILG